MEEVKEKKKTKEKKHHPKLKKFLIIIIILGVLFGLYIRFVGTMGLFVKEYAIHTDKLPASFDGLKLVHFSDIHYGTIIDSKRLDEIVAKINELKPDIVVFTGDLYDESIELSNKYKEEIQTSLSKINAKLGKYAVSGNHDYSNDGYSELIKNSGFTYLASENELIYYNGDTPIRIEGYPSYLKDKPDYKSYEEDYYTITLIHEPDAILKLKSNSNLVLAGHSHGGQVRLPFIGAIYTPEGSKKYYNEYYKVNDKDLYISYGLGTSLLRIRLFDHPSFNFYRFFVD